MSKNKFTNKNGESCKRLYFAKIKKIFKSRFIPIINDDMKCDNVDIFSTDKCLIAVDSGELDDYPTLTTTINMHNRGLNRNDTCQFIDETNVHFLYNLGDFSITFKKDEKKKFKDIINTFFVFHNMLFYKNDKSAKLITSLDEDSTNEYDIKVGDSFTAIYKKIYKRIIPSSELSVLYLDTYQLKINTRKGYIYGEEREYKKK